VDDKVTIEKIARYAGVSPSTVSRALNQPELVKARTRENVYEAVEELKYVPPAVKHEGTAKTAVIGLAVPDIKLSFVGELIRDIQLELSSTSCDLLLIDMKGERRVSLFFTRNSFYRKKIDAVIIFSAILDEGGVNFFNSVNIPVVLMQSRSGAAKSISTNNFLGGHDATEYLLSRGYRKIGFVGWNYQDDRLMGRFNGYRSALEKAGIEFQESMACYDTIDVEGGYKATERLLEGFKPDAVFYSCDAMAAGGLKFFRTHNFKVPDEVGVMGFDNIELASALGLTTMKQFIREKARMAISYLMDRLSGNSRKLLNEEICITPRVVIRETTR